MSFDRKETPPVELRAQPGGRAAPIRTKLDEALAAVASLEAEIAQLALDAAEGKSGAVGKLSALRDKIDAEARTVDELRAALHLAENCDRAAAATIAIGMRSDQMKSFTTEMQARHRAMTDVLKAAAALAEAYGRYSEATLRAQISVPSGTHVPVVNLGPQNCYGAAFGPCDRLILAELYRVAPDRSDGIGRFVLPFAEPPNELVRGNPANIAAGLDEFAAGDRTILEEVGHQLEQLNSSCMANIDRLAA